VTTTPASPTRATWLRRRRPGGRGQPTRVHVASSAGHGAGEGVSSYGFSSCMGRMPGRRARRLRSNFGAASASVGHSSDPELWCHDLDLSRAAYMPTRGAAGQHGAPGCDGSWRPDFARALPTGGNGPSACAVACRDAHGTVVPPQTGPGSSCGFSARSGAALGLACADGHGLIPIPLGTVVTFTRPLCRGAAAISSCGFSWLRGARAFPTKTEIHHGL
jgi:hypothetical protein